MSFSGTSDNIATVHFKHGADFQSVAIQLGYDRSVAEEVARVATLHFGDLRWVESHEADTHFLRNLMDLRDTLNFGIIGDNDAVSAIGADLDFLYPLANYFPFTKALNFAAMACMPASQSCALVASVRNEGPFLLEWLAYNRAIGLQDIYIYTNDNGDGSTELLQQLARHGIIKLFLNQTGRDVIPQIKAYEHSLFLLPELRRFEWVFYLDADEFFVPAASYDFDIRNVIAAVNAKYSQNLPSCISYNWNWIGSGGAIRRAHGYVTERFQTGRSTLHPNVKSLVRPSAAMSMWPVHTPNIAANGFAVNSVLEPTSIEQSAYVFPDSVTSGLSSGMVNHYWQKSFEEFLVKQARGSSAPYRDTSLFFKWDIREEEKVISSIPSQIREKMCGEHAKLLALPEVSELILRVEEMYTQLCLELMGPDNIESRYSREKLQT
jgi:hypothetical protein